MSKTVTYKNKKNIQYKTKAILVFAILILLLLMLILILSNVKSNQNQKEQAMMNGQFYSIEDILEYYGCKFIRQTNSSEEGFEIDIYTNFKYDLYYEEESNEEFYYNVINQIAKFLNYHSFRMIDDSKEEKIEIQVIGDGNKIQTIYINGIEDYFIYMDSQISLKKYKEFKTTEISVQAPELVNCLQNGWDANTNFGSRESIFQNYYIYFDEGIKTRKINGKIYHIIFTNQYENPVVNGFTVQIDNKDVIARLGNPTFTNSDGSVIGYKSNELYVFFEKDQISIYRNTKEGGFEEFFELVDAYLAKQYTVLEFMNELTYIWPDYDEYTYDSETVFLSYPNKGVDIKINYDNTDGIVLYNNIGVSQDTINQYLEHTEFVAQLQVDNVYQAELRRYQLENSYGEKCKQYANEYETEDDRNRGRMYDYYMKMTDNQEIISIYFIAKNSEFPNCELNENVSSYIWLKDDFFVYSIKKKGIYYYDLKNQTKGTLMTGNEDYEIDSYQNGLIQYDNDKALRVNFEGENNEVID